MYNYGIEKVSPHAEHVGLMSHNGVNIMTGKKYTPKQQILSFWNRVNKDGSIPAHMPHLGKCWEWLGTSHRQGYGYIRIDGI